MLSSDASFAKSTLLQVFTSVAVYVALNITTKYCSNKAIFSSYISLFYFVDASFTKNFWKNFPSVIEGVFAFTKYL